MNGGPPLTIDAGRGDDLGSCVALWLGALEARDGAPPPPAVAERCRNKFDLPTVSWRVVRDAGGDVRGFGLVTAPGSGRPQDPADAAYLSLLAVAPAAQGRGLGIALLEALLDDVRTAGHLCVVLHVLADNDAALRLYLSRGWSPVGDMFAHALDGRPTVTLGSHL